MTFYRCIKDVYRRISVLIKEDDPKGNPWDVRFLRMFDMSNDSKLFRTQEQLEEQGWILDGNVFHKDDKEYLPLYEAKMTAPFDHRAASVKLSKTARVRQGQPERLNESKHMNPSEVVLPRYWVPSTSLSSKFDLDIPKLLLGFSNVTSPTNERTMLATIIPFSGVGHSMPLILTSFEIEYVIFLMTNLNSFCFDYFGRQKIGGINFTYFILKQLPILGFDITEDKIDWDNDKIVNWIFLRAIELIYTSYDIGALSDHQRINCPPFIWNIKRRFLIRCELDAAFFHLYRIQRDDVDYIMDTFPIVKRKDEQEYGHYRTKDTILEICDEMAQVMAANQTAIADGREPTAQYQTRLDPPPGPPCDENREFIPMEQWGPDNWPPHIHRPKDWKEKTKPVPVTVPYQEDPQVFPWKGREQFVRDLIPHLVKERPGLTFETYRTAAVLASRPEKLRDLLPENAVSQTDALPRQTLKACTFPDTDHLRPRKIRESLEEKKKWVNIDLKSGATTVPDKAQLDPLPRPLKPLVPFVLMAAEELDRLKRDTTKRARARLEPIKTFESSLAA